MPMPWINQGRPFFLRIILTSHWNQTTLPSRDMTRYAERTGLPVTNIFAASTLQRSWSSGWISVDDALRLVQGYVEHYNNIRLNSAIGYITPKDRLAGRQQETHSERDRKLAAARQHRQVRRQQGA
jgi:hypothetical protein